MTRLTCACTALVALVVLATRPTAQTVYPTGTTIYDPDRSWNGFTVLSPLATPAVLVIDMNGTVVKRWDNFNNSAGGPARVLPGGFVMAANGARPPFQESLELVLRDFDGKDMGPTPPGRREAAASDSGELTSTGRRVAMPVGVVPSKGRQSPFLMWRSVYPVRRKSDSQCWLTGCNSRMMRTSRLRFRHLTASVTNAATPTNTVAGKAM